MKRVLFGLAGGFLSISQVSADIFGKSTAEKEHIAVNLAIQEAFPTEGSALLLEKLERAADKVNGYAAKYNKEALSALQKSMDRHIAALKTMNAERRLGKSSIDGIARAYDLILEEGDLKNDFRLADGKVKKIFADPFAKKEKRFAYDLYRELLQKITESAEKIAPEWKLLPLAEADKEFIKSTVQQFSNAGSLSRALRLKYGTGLALSTQNKWEKMINNIRVGSDKNSFDAMVAVFEKPTDRKKLLEANINQLKTNKTDNLLYGVLLQALYDVNK